MTVNYDNVWKTMNDVESVTAKICSAREILDCAIDAHEQHKHDKVEHLLHAIDEFLVYYLQEFDDKFRSAWQATVGDLRDGDKELYGAVLKEKEYYEGKQLKKWTLPIEQIGDDYFVTFPDDLLKTANLKEGDDVEWVDNGDGSYSLKKVNLTTYDEMIAAGLTMTADGFWIKE